MTKKSIILLLAILLFSFMFSGNVNAETNISDENLYKNLKGKIILRVEASGEAYYVHPEKQKMYYLGRPADAFQVMREQGIGAKTSDIERIKDVDIKKYGHDINFANRHLGKIFLQVEEKGEAWYINPNDSMRYYLGRPNDAFGIMRKLGLGISEKNFNMLSNNYNTYTNEQLGIEFQYPNYWILTKASSDEFNNYGHVAFFETADTNKLIEQKKIHPAYSKNLVISYWNIINNEHAKGGTWIGDREYTGLDDFLSNNGGTKQKISEIIINEKKGYEVSIGGYGSNYGIMVEKNGIYELSFERLVDKTKLSEGERMVIDSFGFIE